ncbi:MAG: hypothetical protein M5U34_25795 [Chloroflexi bacterium]|nr:hypothetical protein [Chloroflexota bacterium]
MDSYEANAFTEAQGQVVGAFANQAAVAIANTRLHHETERRAEELAVLHQLGLDIASVVAMDELFTAVTAAIVQKLYPDDFGFLPWMSGKNSFYPITPIMGCRPPYWLSQFPWRKVSAGLSLKVGSQR